MAQALNTARLRHFVQQLARLLESTSDEAEILAQGRVLLGALVAHDDWLPEAFAQADPQYYQQYLLFADALERFSIVSFVWGPGQATPIHDHTVWGLVGLLRGREEAQSFIQDGQGRWQAHGAPAVLLPGQVEAVSPRMGDVHRVRNALADQVSISIHVYGGNIGAVQRSVFLEDGTRKAFVSGYSSQLLPNLFSMDSPMPIPSRSYSYLRQALLERREIALIDVREEDQFAQAHPLFAANFPAGRIEIEVGQRIPRKSTPIVVYDNGEGLAQGVAQRLLQWGYTQVALLEGGLQGWRDAGGELFIDVNVPSKSFGELVESERHTPSLSAPEVQALITEKADVVVLDVRRVDEYQTMSIPGATSVPGGELVLRARSLAPDPQTRIIVNCAGRTRSIIGTQSLLNAGVPNPVSALRNGTIGWTLAGQKLDHGAQRRFGPVDAAQQADAAQRARAVADRAGVSRASPHALQQFAGEALSRTTYYFDVRTPEEYAAGHLPGFRSAPGGQLVQETDHSAPVRGARMLLSDTDGVRANMTASWLAQMGWDVWVLDGVDAASFDDTSVPPAALPAPKGDIRWTSPTELSEWQAQSAPGALAVLDLSTSANYVKRHIPGAWFVLRSELERAVQAIPRAQRYVLTCGSSLLARYAAHDLAVLTGAPVFVLQGGTQAWIDAGLPLEAGETHMASPRSDRYRRPYEGTDAPREAMQAYLDWEYGLVEQLGRDGTHGFKVI